MEMKELAFTDPERWEYGNIEFEKKYYYNVPLSCLFGKPRKVFESVQRIKAEIATKGYIIPEEAMLLMEVGFLSGKLLLEVQKPEDYDASVIEMEKSKIYTAVHYGPFKTIGEKANSFKERVAREKGIAPTSTYYWDFRHGPNLVDQRADRFVILCRL